MLSSNASTRVSGRAALPEVVRIRVCTARARALVSARAPPLRAEASDGARRARAAASGRQRRGASGRARASARGLRSARNASCWRQRQRLAERALRERRRVELTADGGGPRERRERGHGARAAAAAQEGQPGHLAARRAERPGGPREGAVPPRVHHLLGAQRSAVARAHLHSAARPPHRTPARPALTPRRTSRPKAILAVQIEYLAMPLHSLKRFLEVRVQIHTHYCSKLMSTPLKKSF